jgi:ATP-binding cassette subfamily F protein 3
VILISHDRHMVELTADRLVLVDGGTALDYAGSMEDYIDFVLGRNQPKGDGGKNGKGGKGSGGKGGAKSREELKALQKAVSEAETVIARAQMRLSALDAALAGKPDRDLARLSMGELSRQRSAVEAELAVAEARWIEAGETLEAFKDGAG